MIIQSDYLEFLNNLKPRSVDLILTDPPFDISKKTGFSNVGEKGIQRFAVNMDFGKLDGPVSLNELATSAYRALRTGGSIIIWYDWKKISYLLESLSQFKMIRLIIWQKTNPVPLNMKSTYLSNSREVAISAVKGGKPTFNDEYHNGVFSYPITRNRIHPNQKHLELTRDLIKIHSRKGDLVVDPFAGSGTTGVAALQLGRRFEGCDIDQEYVNLANERLKSFIS